MQVTERIHAIKIPFKVPISKEASLDRFAYAYLVFGDKIENLEYLFSSWESPIQGRENISRRMDESLAYLKRIHAAVINNSNNASQQDIMELCQKVASELGLPSLAVMPLVAEAFASSVAAESI